ncbi:P-loop containing nucleoside triphosphate hydrolase protein [Exidia glandulosa HHB12029]|uniref:p-loop containing nucleoside triphosphate hydrolase protein n=1 Tax=Exidia glandulosa HHB12029 TaxID=1314781 RepID=A0A165M3S7_EXIGL|nr:P-loop containing nucleoside triphosphate hydrolase protein [Exidia glandulosa HHB12029]
MVQTTDIAGSTVDLDATSDGGATPNGNGTVTTKTVEANGKTDATASTSGSEDEKTESEAAAAEPETEAGSRNEYKRVDEIWDSDNSEWVLRDSGPVRPKSKEDKYREFAFIIVRSLHHTTFAVKSTLVEIKSRYLKKVCQQVIQQYNGISWNSRVLRIEPQTFLTFFPQLEARLEMLTSKAGRSEDESTMADHLKLLLDYIRAEHASTLAEIASLLSHSEITFDLMWSILLPGTVFFTHCSVTGEPRAYRLISSDKLTPHGGVPFWRLECEYIEATGARNAGPRFGFSDRTIDIPLFKGTVKIASLRAYPMKWHPREEEMRARLIARGKRWQELDGVHHRHYNAVAHLDRGCRYVKVTVNCRIMVDVASFKLVNPNYSIPSVKGADEDSSSGYDSYGDSDDSDAEEDEEKDTGRAVLLSTLTDDHLLLASPLLYGFSLGDKLWLEFNVEHVKTFKWNDEAFERLVLPPKQKNLVKSLVESHKANTHNFDDFVEGKGKGLIINLFGPPGVGKTLSAEATSEHVRRPLYVVGAGELGTHASALDTSLTEIFQVAAAWKAIVLIDEADVFLEQRSLHDLGRNALVAVFLRQLEYYQGILFLTTNRVRSFDEAFQSRIHVALRYRDLEEDARLTIWRSFLEKVGLSQGAMTAEEERTLAGKDLNGRQIKNAVRTAGAVAASRGESVSFIHLMEVLEVMEQFEQDFRELATEA